MAARHRRPRGRGRRFGSRGETLAELLVTVTLLGIVGAGVIGAIATILLANTADRRAADGEAVMRTFVAAVQRAAYVECAEGDEPYDTVATQLEVPRHASDAPAFRADIAPCGAGGGDGIQRVEIELDPLDPDGTPHPGAALRATVYKRDPT
jgi:hypothetical protein